MHKPKRMTVAQITIILTPAVTIAAARPDLDFGILSAVEQTLSVSSVPYRMPKEC